MRYGFALRIVLLLALTSVLPHDCSAFTPHLVNDGRTRASLRHAATDAGPAATLRTISVTLPSNWNDGSSQAWSAEAAAVLNEYGAVALVSHRDDDKPQDGGVIKHNICDNANRSIISRVQEMQRRIEARGVDPRGLDAPYRFAELICRDEGGRRYDVPVPWLGDTTHNHNTCSPTGVGSLRSGAPLTAGEAESVAALHASMGRVVASVTEALWSPNSRHHPASDVAAAGFLMNEPGSRSQDWHRDGPDAGFIDCFVPLIDLQDAIGPTALQPGTHRTTSGVGDDEHETGGVTRALAPLLHKGDLLLFDYRTLHRGLGNVSKATTRTLAYVVYRRRETGALNSIGDVHNFQAALTLEY